MPFWLIEARQIKSLILEINFEKGGENNDLIKKDNVCEEIQKRNIDKNLLSSFPNFNDSTYFWLENLGKGGFGIVRKAYNISSNEFLAIKSFKKKGKRELLEQIMLEDELLSKIENIRTSQPEYYEYFLKYNGVFMNPKEKNALVLEMESGCCALANILEAGKVYTCGELLYVLPKLVEGFSILEENGIANRDVKPESGKSRERGSPLLL